MVTRLIVGCALAAIAFACTVDRASEQYKCSNSLQCEIGRTCSGGYCVVDNDVRHDAPKPPNDNNNNNCPPGCTLCNTTLRTCAMNCGSGFDCGNLTCPTGWSCTITCNGAGACADVTCQMNSKCSIECNGPGACQDISCGNACACDLTCVSGDCGAISCPTYGGGNACTIDGNAGTACDSQRNPSCNKC